MTAAPSSSAGSFAATRPAAAEFHLGRAVRARRGLPFVDVPQGPTLSAKAAVVDACWQSAVEEYAQVLLVRGRYEQTRELLFGFLAQHPTRERAWGVDAGVLPRG